MRFVWIAGAALLVGCGSPGLTGLSLDEVDNPDALEPIPDPPTPVERDQVDDSPYDPPAPGENTQDGPPPPADPPIEPPPPAPGCPADTICVSSLPWVETNTTVGGTSQFDSYACAPGTDESGPERLYRVELTEPGFLAVTLWGMAPGVDIDVHLLGSADSGDCIDRGHWDAGGYLPAGTWYVAADSWVDGSGQARAGAYSIRLHFTPLDALAGDGLSTTVMERALTAFDTAWQAGETSSFVYTVADFDLPSSQPRLWTFDLATGDLLFHLHVSHGQGSSASDPAMVAQMSNINGSHMSSVGLMRTAETYQGSNGYSMRMDGLEPGFNDLVRPRAIVFHGASYATPAFVAANGYLGRSWGCPAVDSAVNAALIDTIKDGTLYLSHFSDASWLATSDYL